MNNLTLEDFEDYFLELSDEYRQKFSMEVDKYYFGQRAVDIMLKNTRQPRVAKSDLGIFSNNFVKTNEWKGYAPLYGNGFGAGATVILTPDNYYEGFIVNISIKDEQLEMSKGKQSKVYQKILSIIKSKMNSDDYLVKLLFSETSSFTGNYRIAIIF